MQGTTNRTPDEMVEETETFFLSNLNMVAQDEHAMRFLRTPRPCEWRYCGGEKPGYSHITGLKKRCSCGTIFVFCNVTERGRGTCSL